MKPRLARFALAAFLAWVCALPADAARNFAYTQNPAIGTALTMGTTVPITFGITNVSNGGQAGERIYQMQFRLNAGGSTFSGATAAPAGWTRTVLTATTATFVANTWANAIAVGGGAKNFVLQVAMRSAGSNTNENLRDIRAEYTDSVGGPPYANRGSGPVNNAGGWLLAALAITSFQITDLAGVPITALIAGQSFRLVMVVRNNSNVAQNPIVSNPGPPTAVKTGTVTQALTGTAGSPLSLASGASGTITFTYGTVATDNGTIEFTAQARRSATVTSPVATSSRIAVGRFVASITPSATCLYVGRNLTITVGLIDAFPFSINNATTTLTPAAGSPITYVSGPNPASPIANVPPNPPPTNVTWTYQINNVGTTNPFNFSVSSTGTLNTVGNPVLTTPASVSANVSRGVFTAAINPTVVNAASTNVEMTVTVTNNGCAAVSSVGITVPAGWTGAADPYSLVWTGGVTAVETWTGAGTTFTAPNLAAHMPVARGGDFAIVFGATPPAAAISTFTVRVTDANGEFMDIPLNVTVNAFKAGTLNDAATRVWREEFR